MYTLYNVHQHWNWFRISFSAAIHWNSLIHNTCDWIFIFASLSSLVLPCLVFSISFVSDRNTCSAFDVIWSFFVRIIFIFGENVVIIIYSAVRTFIQSLALVCTWLLLWYFLYFFSVLRMFSSSFFLHILLRRWLVLCSMCKSFTAKAFDFFDFSISNYFSVSKNLF